MNTFIVLGSSFLVRCRSFLLHACLLALVASLLPATANAAGRRTKNKERGTKVFRPKPGEFPPLEKAHSYRGELVFVDRANRRGSIRIDGVGRYRFAAPSPFALLPCGIVRYRGAPADLRDIPLGTVLHVKAFLPPDPRISAVPVLPVDNRLKKLGYAGTGVAPAENHVLLLEDDLSHGLRHGLIWELNEVDITNHSGTISVTRRTENGADPAAETETLSFDAATRIWRGRELLEVADLIHEGAWPASGKRTSTGRRFTWDSPGSPPREEFSPVSTSLISGSTAPHWIAPPGVRTKDTRTSFAAAGCPPRSMLSNMVNSAAPK